jgi:hypothetical protein
MNHNRRKDDRARRAALQADPELMAKAQAAVSAWREPSVRRGLMDRSTKSGCVPRVATPKGERRVIA